MAESPKFCIVVVIIGVILHSGVRRI